ncbi:aspartyl-tRNA synthetase-like protein [Amniculicola lignicola CBS 123094]|uniref:Probable aspartate--tRNA ligase, cytoplasmic n=1 Tax=Amniculicola lignicola CBS 123094 TaxID=1392246 RepID=A0A6A5X3P9_9PLEO|nr:aspartyl-tRNA synthetase-like protein [Amniculicola lignicola CBS 123094]
MTEPAPAAGASSTGDAPPPVDENGVPLTKNALKKLQKDKEKAEKKAAAAAKELAIRQQKAAADAADVSKEDYGELPLIGSKDFKPTNTPRVDLSNIADFEDKEVTFRCWVENARVQSAKLAFLNLRQGLNTVQAVVAASEKLSKQMVKFSGSVSTESTIVVTGEIKRVKEQIKSASIKDFEVHIKRLFVEVKADSPMPLQVEDAERPLPSDGVGDEEEPQQTEAGARPLVSLNVRLNNRTLDLRAKINHSIFVIKSGVCALFQEFLSQKGFTLIHTPKILGAASEGGANVFELKYFDRPAYLAQSPQFYKQMLIASRFQKVMEIGPVFRAENSNTARHLTEFTGLDLEMEFQENYHEVMGVLEDLMLFIFKELKARYKKETDLVRSAYHVDEFKLPESGKVPRIPFTEGIKMLREAGEELGDYDDLSTPQEKHLGRLVLEKYGSDFYTLDQFPLAIRPAYTFPSPADPLLSNSYDMFMRGQEICSGAQRIHDAALLTKMMIAHDPPIDPMGAGTKDYVESFKYGCPPHGGGGFGLERIVQFWLGLPNIRMCSLFPRDPNRVVP